MTKPNPAVVQAIIGASAKTGADPVALLATSLQESGGRYNAVGDQGTSFGPFQYHQGGALGSRTPAWAMSNAEIQDEAQRFAANQIHGGKGAAALQRPADPSGYAAAVDAWKAQARQILAQHGSAAPPGTMASSVTGPRSPSASLTGGVGVSGAQQAATQRTSLLQSIIDQNSQLAGIATTSVPMPVMPYISPPARPVQAVHNPAMTPRGARAKRVGAYDFPTTGTKIIGTPYHGTHTLGNWESDNAIDISTPIGSPIYATQSGVIGSQFGSLGASSGSRFAGLRLHLKTANDEFYYAHLSRFAPGIKPGARVQAGQIIGYSGAANGVAHLHIGARSGNPLQLFKPGSR